jgi:hypothetical protein
MQSILGLAIAQIVCVYAARVLMVLLVTLRNLILSAASTYHSSAGKPFKLGKILP